MAGTRFLFACVVGLALGLPGLAWAYPTSLNIVPTADVLEPGALSVQVESDSHPTPFSPGAVGYVLTQVGLTSRLEAGVDLMDINAGARLLVNAKWQFLAEDARAPAMAVGLLDMEHGTELNGCYLALAKDVGSLRLHAGWLMGGGHRAMLGAEYWPTERTGVYADWTTGAGAYHTLGLTQDVGHGLWLSTYYARGNTGGEGDFAGLGVGWEACFRHAGQEGG